MTFKNPDRPNPEGRWLNTPVSMATVFNPSQLGNYQQHIHQDSHGYLYAVVVRTILGLQMRVSLYSNNAVAGEADLNFPTGPTMSLISETALAYGFTSDSQLSITELSSVLFGDKIYVAMIYTVPVIGRCVELFSFDIQPGVANACTHLRYFLPDTFGADTNYRSCDIDCWYGTGAAFLWLSFIEYYGEDYRYVWYQEPLPFEPQSDGSYIDTIVTELKGGDDTAYNHFIGIRHCFEDRQLFSVSHGYLDASGTLPNIPMTTPAAVPRDLYDKFVGWLIPNDAQQLSIDYQAGGGQYTDEMAQDAVGNILTDTATVDFTYDDGTPQITADVKNDSITFAKMQNIATDSLIGRDTALAGDPENITLGTGLAMSGAGALTCTVTGIPSGVICMWSGLLVAIPAGWALCDGGGGRPDLRSMFIKGAAAGVDPGVTGGASTHQHTFTPSGTNAGTTIGNHSNHVFTQPSNHADHTFTQPSDHPADNTGTESSAGLYNVMPGGTPIPAAGHTHPTPSLTHSGGAVNSHSVHSGGAVDAHSAHSVTAEPAFTGVAGNTGSSSSEPAFYSLAFIIKT